LINFTLESAFCRTKSNHGGSWIYIEKGYNDQRIKLHVRIRGWKMYVLSLIELLGYKTIVIGIYRTPDTKFDTFLNKLQLIIQK